MAKTCSPTAFHRTYVITHYTAWYSLVRWSVGSDCFLTTTEPLQSSFSIDPRPPRSGDLGPIVLARIRARLLCSHMPKRTELRGGNAPGSETKGQVWKHPQSFSEASASAQLSDHAARNGLTETWYRDVFIFLVPTWYRSTGSFDNTSVHSYYFYCFI